MKTYLCGGINGLSDTDCRDWREVAKGLLQTETLDPMRRDYRGREDDSVAGIVQGDLEDIAQCRFILVNATRPSWGTAMEIVYAKELVIVAFVGDAPVSPWLRYHCTTIVRTVEEACAFINTDAATTLPPREPLPRDPQTGRCFDGYYDDLLPCGCVHFYHGGVGRCSQHA